MAVTGIKITKLAMLAYAYNPITRGAEVELKIQRQTRLHSMILPRVSTGWRRHQRNMRGFNVTLPGSLTVFT